MLASGAVVGDPPLPAGEDLAFVVVERCSATRLVVGDEAVELLKGGQRVGLLEPPMTGWITDALPTNAASGTWATGSQW